MFVLLTAQLPFWDNDRRERRRRVCKEALDLESDEIARELSPEAKDLLYGMLTKPADRRLTIDQVLAHPWFNCNGDTFLDGDQLDEKNTGDNEEQL